MDAYQTGFLALLAIAGLLAILVLLFFHWAVMRFLAWRKSKQQPPAAAEYSWEFSNKEFSDREWR